MHDFTGCKREMLGSEALQPGPSFGTARKLLIIAPEGREEPETAQKGADSASKELRELAKQLSEDAGRASEVSERLNAVADALDRQIEPEKS
jgi:hypothetical protein